MRKTFLTLLTVLIISGPASAADYTGRVPWKQANLATLQGADRNAVFKFINATRPVGSFELPSPVIVGQFGWINVGEAESDFIVLLDNSERGYFTKLWIYRQGTSGELKIQELNGWNMGPIKRMVRDLNGDGVDELIIRTELDAPRGSWTPMASMPAYPAVYRLSDGRYVEASREFPNFYDTEVLPKLDIQIRKALSPQAAAMLTLEKDKILRVLGRDPTAGLNDAYRWMDSGDSQLIQCAIATFADIGGHDQEMQQAKQALQPALLREMQKHDGG